MKQANQTDRGVEKQRVKEEKDNVTRGKEEDNGEKTKTKGKRKKSGDDNDMVVDVELEVEGSDKDAEGEVDDEQEDKKKKRKKKTKQPTTFRPNFLTDTKTIATKTIAMTTRKKLQVEVLITSSAKVPVPQQQDTLLLVKSPCMYIFLFMKYKY